MTKETKEFYDFGPFRADTVRRVLLRDGQAVPVTSKVFDTLEVLLRNRDRVLTKDELLKEIWPNTFVEESNLTQNVSTLRKALCELPGEHRFIATVPGKGYRFVGAVREPEPPPPPPEKTPAPSRRPPLRSAVLAAIAVVCVLGAAIALWRFRAPRFAPPPSLAVLPFSQLTTQPGDEYLGIGIADAVITRLSNVKELVVRPTRSVLRYAKPSDPVTAARELGVDEILSGSIQQEGEQVRVTLQLISAKDGRSIWAETFDETTTGLFGIEDSVSSRVAGKMAAQLPGGEREELARHYTEDAEAWRLNLKGRYESFRFTPDGLRRAIDYFNQAIARDPAYALAWAGLADAYTTASDWVLPPREALSKAEAAARKAISFDDRLAESHASLAHALMHQWKLAAAGQEFERALALTPNNTAIYFAYGEYLTAIGKNDESAAQLRKALKLDPLSPALANMLSWPLYLKGDYEGALKASQDAIRLDTKFWVGYMYTGYSLTQMHRFPEAIAAFEKARQMNPRSTINLSGLGATFALANRTQEASAILTQLDDMSKQQYVSPMDFVYVYAALGQRDRAIEYLNRAYTDQSEMMLYLPIYGLVGGLNRDPRFQELLRRVHGP